MNPLELLLTNLLSPPIFAFAAGVIAVLIRCPFRFPEPIYQAITIYLLFAIGFKGGVSISETGLAAVAWPLAATIFAGSIIPVVVFFVAWKLVVPKVADAASLAAHYGSVSAVTFLACYGFLTSNGVQSESFLPALMAVMEIPALAVAIFLGKHFQRDREAPIWKALHEVVTGNSIFLLICGLVIGAVAGAEGMKRAAPFFVDPFYGVLILFLLEMGIVAGARLQDLSGVGWGLIAMGMILPLVQGCFGLLLAGWLGLSVGGATLFAVLTASASYIAAPAAVRIALPDANLGYSITASLGITFPFNLAVGIPLYFGLARAFIGS
ncbi:MAG: sodium-dependent bicarbonate transport family permease [Opitutaceae bacterium]